jgi:4-methyl-5(b-hydroxyethyl)-thiazole monophosphate biosynthesis
MEDIMTKNALIILAEGFEEIEAITPIDLLRRAGIKVTIAGLNALEVKGSHDIIVKAEILLQQISGSLDALILPGGPGHTNLLNSQTVLDLVISSFKQNILCAAICAAPAIFGKAGILKGKKATCFPGYEAKLGGGIFIDKKVVTDGKIITSRGAGTAIDFALEIINYLEGEAASKKVAEKIVLLQSA